MAGNKARAVFSLDIALGYRGWESLLCPQRGDAGQGPQGKWKEEAGWGTAGTEVLGQHYDQHC